MKNKKGFTLIELLAVIIILGILVLVAIPAVSSYITNSRKSAYVNTAKAIMKGAMNLANDGSLDLTDTDTTYYIPSSCVDVENNKVSPYGDFVKAYTAVGFDGESFSYYWLSVDSTGMGVNSLVENDKLDTSDIVGEIDASNIDSDILIPSKSKIMVYNSDCSSSRPETGLYEVTFNSGEGTFSGGSTKNVLSFPKRDTSEIKMITKYSYTQNIDESGNKLSDYGHNWTNANIRGTDRGDTSEAHVVTIPGASTIHLKIQYGGEYKQYDYLCVWKGYHPDYTAVENCDTAIGGKIGASNSSLGVLTTEFDVEGSTVTIGYRTDSSGIGDGAGKGYGYYAIITGEGKESAYTGTYKVPTKTGYQFDAWIDDETGQRVTATADELSVRSDKSFTASYSGFGRVTFKTFNNYYVISTGTTSSDLVYTLSPGATQTVQVKQSRSGMTNNGQYWYVTYDANGGSSTPSQQSFLKIFPYYYTYQGITQTGTCGTIETEDVSTSSHYIYNITYTVPSESGTICTITPKCTTYSDNSTYSTYPKNLAGAISREGYTFAGWLSSADGQVYAAGTSFTPTGDTTMTAQWTAN